MATFSPQAFLTNQGWEGPGSGLRKGSIKKPVTVAHKTNLKGIGKERDTGYAWWDDVFSMVANKKKGGDNPVLRKTSTGIHSPLPPGSLSAVSSQPASGSSTPVASTSTSHFHTDIIGHAKLEAARKEFYAKFLRGRPLEGTVQEAVESLAVEDEVAVVQGDASEEAVPSLSKEEKKKQKELRKAEKEERRKAKKEKKDKKKKRKATEDASEGLPVEHVIDSPGSAKDETDADAPTLDSKDSKKERKKRKRDVEVDEAASQSAAEDSLPSTVGTSEAVDKKAARAAKKARKESKKTEAVDEDIEKPSELPSTDMASGQSTPLESTTETSKESKAARKARKEEKRRRKAEKA